MHILYDTDLQLLMLLILLVVPPILLQQLPQRLLRLPLQQLEPLDTPQKLQQEWLLGQLKHMLQQLLHHLLQEPFL